MRQPVLLRACVWRRLRLCAWQLFLRDGELRLSEGLGLCRGGRRGGLRGGEGPNWRLRFPHALPLRRRLELRLGLRLGLKLSLRLGRRKLGRPQMRCDAGPRLLRRRPSSGFRR